MEGAHSWSSWLAISVDPLLGASLSPVAAGIGPFLHSLLLAGPGPAHLRGLMAACSLETSQVRGPAHLRGLKAACCHETSPYKAALNYTHSHFTHSLPIQLECLTKDHGG